MNYLEQLFSLQGRTALVTGGATGIGRMIAEGLLKSGARVIIASRKRTACEAVAAELSASGECTGLGADLSSETGVFALRDAIEQRASRLDILINNAGTTWGDPIESYPWNAWNKVMAVNVVGLFTLTRELVPLLHAASTAEDPSRVINVGSVVANRPIGNNAYAYAASKAAVHHLTLILANELAGRRITVNALAPGFFATRMTAHVTSDPDRHREMSARIPLARLGVADDVAGAAVMLCGRAGRYVSGAILPVDGGLSAAP